MKDYPQMKQFDRGGNKRKERKIKSIINRDQVGGVRLFPFYNSKKKKNKTKEQSNREARQSFVFDTLLPWHSCFVCLFVFFYVIYDL